MRCCIPGELKQQQQQLWQRNWVLMYSGYQRSTDYEGKVEKIDRKVNYLSPSH